MIRFPIHPEGPQDDDFCLVYDPVTSTFDRAGGAWGRRRADLSLADPGLPVAEGPQGRLWIVEGSEAPEATSLRGVLAEAEEPIARAAVRGAELLVWRRHHRFCGACGTPTRWRSPLTVADCPACGLEAWPRVTPAVIMLVHRGDEVLLVRHARPPRPGAPVFHSCLAGFVEAGESLEEAVVRETEEEVGLRVGPPTYVTSQAWPFPHSLMAAFFAPWQGGDPHPDGVEIAEAGWYRRDALPNLPPPISVARALVDTFFQEHL